MLRRVLVYGFHNKFHATTLLVYTFHHKFHATTFVSL